MPQQRTSTMKLSDLKPCAACGGRLEGVFYCIEIKPACVSKELQQAVGLSRAFGFPLGLAQVFAGDAAAVKLEEPEAVETLFLCCGCYVESQSLAVLVEREQKREEIVG